MHARIECANGSGACRKPGLRVCACGLTFLKRAPAPARTLASYTKESAVAKMQSPQSVNEAHAGIDPWELQALGQNGIPVLERMERLKQQAVRLAGRNDARSFMLLFEERLLNDLVVDMASAYLDLERVSHHIRSGRYKVGETGTALYRGIVH